MTPATRNSRTRTPVATFPANRMEAIFNRVFGDDGDFATQAWAAVPLAMWEDEDHLWIEAELPGMAESDVEITAHKDMLSIKGQRKAEQARHYLYNERSYGWFERTVTLPDVVNAEAVRATLRDGVLRIELPKSAEAKPRKIGRIELPKSAEAKPRKIGINAK